MDMRTTRERDEPGARSTRGELDGLLEQVALGDAEAFEALYEQIAGVVYGLVRRVVRDPVQSEEVAQDVLLEVWRSAARFDPGRGTAFAWVTTMAHRRAVDLVRSVEASRAREQRAVHEIAHDDVSEAVVDRLDRERVRRCLDRLTEVQRASVKLAYYGGYTHQEVAGLLKVPLGTVKTRMRDGLIKLRDCLGVVAE